MLRKESMSTKMARVVNEVTNDNAGQVTEAGLDEILRSLGIVRQRNEYIRRLCDYGYLHYDRGAGEYHSSDESKATATITITVKPSLFGEEVRRHLVEALAAYGGVIEVSDVTL